MSEALGGEAPPPNPDDIQEGPAPSADQEDIITEAQTGIETANFKMNRLIDLGEIDEAFEWAAKLVQPLSTTELSPRKYYILYHVVSAHLIELSVTIQDPNRISDRQIAEQYEAVQYNHGALQRLYLMATIGPELSKRKVARIQEMFEDIVDMLRQAQDPVHALFLRHYILSVFKQSLPDHTPQDLERSLRFLMGNFAQMNRYWVRIADTAPASERFELSVLVGTNIQRLTSLRGVTLDLYSKAVLPFITKHVELCEDKMAQEFILQSIVHAFPEEYHIFTLEKLFAIFSRVEQGVKILFIVNQLLERLLNYVGDLIQSGQGKTMFVTIAKNIEELFNAEGHLALVDKFETLEKLVRFALKVSPEDIRNVKNLMKFTQYHIDLAIGDDVLTQPQPSAKLRQLIECPIATFTTGDSLYDLDHLPVLIKRLMPDDRRSLAATIANLFIHSDTRIRSLQEVRFILSLCVSLVREGPIKSCFYSLFHLIEGNGVIGTVSLLQELANAMDETDDVAADRAVLPIGFIVLRLLVEAEAEDRTKLVQFLVRYGQNARSRNPATTVFLYVEAAKVLETLPESEAAAAELADTAVQIWQEMTNVAAKQRLYNYLLQFMITSKAVDLALNAQLCNFASTYADFLESVKALSACAPLFWRADGRLQEAQNVQACLSKATKAAVTATDMRIVLEGLYIVMEWTAFCLVKQITLDQRWVNAFVGIIADKHQEVKSKGQSVEAIVSPTAAKSYANTVKFLTEKELVSFEAAIREGREGEAEDAHGEEDNGEEEDS
jgi:hypothetical protein